MIVLAKETVIRYIVFASVFMSSIVVVLLTPSSAEAACLDGVLECPGVCKTCNCRWDGSGYVCFCNLLDGMACFTGCSDCSIRSNNCPGGGGCVPNGCECETGECTKTTSCTGTCPSGWSGSCDCASCDSCQIVCDPCGNAKTCYKCDTSTTDPVCGNGILEGNENCESGDPSGVACAWGWRCSSGASKECSNCLCNDCPECFASGTDILMADGSTKDIELVREGEEIMTFNFETGLNETGIVSEREELVSEGIYNLNNGLIRVTGDHPFFTGKVSEKVSTVVWASINPKESELEEASGESFTVEEGDFFRTVDDTWVEVTSLVYIPGAIPVYNLTVESGSGTYYANGLLVHNKCDCNCACDTNGDGIADGLTFPSTPTLVSPINNVLVKDLRPTLDWSDISWGQDQKDCVNDNDPCACTAGESGVTTRHTYDLYFGTNASPSLLGKATNCSSSWNNYTCGIASSQYQIPTTNYHYPLQPNTTYYWAVRGVNRGPDSGPNDGCSCITRGNWSAVQSFHTGNPPEITNIEVVPQNSCVDVNGNSTGWTGSLDYPNTENPLDIAVTIRDEEGYRDVHTLWFAVAPPNPTYQQNNNCNDDLYQYFGTTIFTGALYNGEQDPRYYTMIQTPQDECEPNCCIDNYTTKTSAQMIAECEAISGCDWSETDATYWGPYGCRGCVRDWNEKAWNPDVGSLYWYDRPCLYPDGVTWTGCHGCYYKTEHPDYTINTITHSVSADGKEVTITFNISFNNSFQEGNLQMYAMARSYVPGGSIFSSPSPCTYLQHCYTTDPSWRWKFDFSAPDQSTIEYPDEGFTGNDFQFNIVARDELVGSPASSGIKYVNVSGEVTHEDQTTEALQPASFLPWNWPPATVPVDLLELDNVLDPPATVRGGDNISMDLTVEDIACNVFYDETNFTPGREWLTTRGGFVYGDTGFYDPFPEGWIPWDQMTLAEMASYPFSGLLTNEEFISLLTLDLGSDWVAGGGTDGQCGSVGAFGAGGPSVTDPQWCSDNYQDDNRGEARGESWYDELRRNADFSVWRLGDASNEIAAFASQTAFNAALSALDGIYVYEPSDPTENLVLSSSAVCSGLKVFFISSGSLTVAPGFSVEAAGACVFVTSEGVPVTFGIGSENGGMAETLGGAFITDDVVTALREPETQDLFDPLLIRGMIFADRVNLMRDLVFADNMKYPAEILLYDPNYLDRLRDMLSSRVFNDFECGIVTGSARCEGWDTPDLMEKDDVVIIELPGDITLPPDLGL